MERNALLRKLHMLYGVIQEREGLCSEYYEKTRELNRKKEDLGDTKAWQRLLITGIFAIPFFVTGFLGDVVLSWGLAEDVQSTVMNGLTVVMGVVIVAFIVVQVLLKKIILKTSRYKKGVEDLIDQEVQLNAEYLGPINAKVQEGLEVFPELGQKYHTTRALYHMIDYVESGRADTIREMIETYEMECHRNLVERNQEEMMYQIAEQQKEIDRLESELNYVTYYKN